MDSAVREELRGRVVSTTRVRKLFEEGVLTCSSRDGERSDTGIACESCPLSACRPLLRIQIEDGSEQVFVLDLPHPSARNLIRIADELAEDDVGLANAELIAHVVNRGHWGKVRFRLA